MMKVKTGPQPGLNSKREKVSTQPPPPPSYKRGRQENNQNTTPALQGATFFVLHGRSNPRVCVNRSPLVPNSSHHQERSFDALDVARTVES